MTIRDISASWLRVPLATPLSDSTHHLTCIDWIVVEVESETGVGRSCMLSFDFAPDLMKRFVESELKPHLVGSSARNIRAAYERCLELTEYVGTDGLAMWGIAAIETALWDLLARELGVPAAGLFGQYAEDVPAYGSGGWISYSDEEMADEMDGHVARGFRAVKIKIGGPSEAWDVDRLHRVRDYLPADVDLLVDANQGLSLDRARRTARLLEELGVIWFEEPLVKDDLEGYQLLGADTTVMLAAGEREFGLQPFRRLAESRAVSVLQPDLMRAGGVTGWRRVAVLAEAYHLKLAPHFYKEYDVHLAAATPNLLAVEWFGWIDPLLKEPLEICEGRAVVPRTPGFGLDFRPEAIAEYKVTND